VLIEWSTFLLDAVPLAVLGALLGLDMVSFPQVMLSRPLVSATIAGAFVGRPAAGLLMGVVLELIALETLPFGASRYAEWGTAGAVGGAVFALQPVSAPGALPVGMLAALAAAFCSSWSMVVVRKMNGRVVRAHRAAVDAGSSGVVTAIQMRCMALDFFRGLLVTFVSLLVFVPLGRALVDRWTIDAVHSRAVVITVAATVAASAVWKIFHTTAKAGWLFLVGLVGGGIWIALQ
jgi:PTS system mannose-specific IIC component